MNIFLAYVRHPTLLKNYCLSCGHVFTKNQLFITGKRQVFDLPQPRLEVARISATQNNLPCMRRIAAQWHRTWTNKRTSSIWQWNEG